MRVLLTGARSPTALAAARQLQWAGFEVFACDTFPRHLTRTSRAVRGSFVVPPPRFEEEAFVRALLAAIEEHRIDVVVPTGEEILYVARHRERLRARCEVLADSFERLEALHNKWTFNRLVAQRGLLAPETWRLEGPEQLAALLREHGRLIVKPEYARFGLRTRVFEEGQALEGLDFGRALLAQRYVVGTERCSFSIVRDGALDAHVCYGLRYRFPMGPGLYFEPMAHAGVEEWVRRFVAGTGFTGCLAFDFIETPGGELFALECNPRMTSGMFLFPEDGTLGRALVGQGRAEPALGLPRMIGLAMLFSVLPQVRSWAELRTWWRSVREARDTFWSREDPGPFWSQLATMPHMRLLARRHGLALRETATHYTEWNGATSDGGTVTGTLTPSLSQGERGVSLERASGTRPLRR